MGIGASSSRNGPAPEGYSDKWESMWTTGLKPGQKFDATRPAPALVNLLTTPSGQLLCAGKAALVPGCGRGYDLLALAAAGAVRVVGLELSHTAAEAAREYVVNQPGLGMLEDGRVRPLLGQTTEPLYRNNLEISVEEGDWLDLAVLPEQFDIGYDYTFFCALHPDMREKWAQAWGRRIKEGGSLVALAFPVTKLMPKMFGPPFAVQVEDYRKVLEPQGFTCITVLPVERENATTRSRAGLEILTVWLKAGC